MLSKLTVTNFALIENAVLDFEKGFTTITGETGSGKSIMLGALKLILGERADYGVIRDSSKKTVVEAIFDVSKLQLAPFFKENDLDYQEDTIIRREINASGKSRAFVNDTPVQLYALKELSDRLIHIHSQHNTINLKSKTFQLGLLDTLGGLTSIKDQVYVAFYSWKRVDKALNEAKENQAKHEREADFNRFLLEELNELNLEGVDFENIAVELKRLEQFEDLKLAFSSISEVINGEQGVSSMLATLTRTNKLEDKRLSELMERIEASRIELVDIASTASSELLDMDASDVDHSSFTVQLDQYNTLLRKHNCSTQEELVAVKQGVEGALSDSTSNENKIKALEEERSVLKKKLETLAAELSKQRKKIVPSIEKEVVDKLNQLKLSNTQLKFVLSDKEVTEIGKDQVQLLFTPNKGMQPQPIEKSASGGELARVMLVLHYLLSTKKNLPTVIFDEIDTGVSGEVAQRIGYLLKEMGGFMQLLAITHLPQVAGSGEHQIRVSKSDVNGETITRFDSLNQEQRIEEVAKLMSGEEINEAALANAKKLMNLPN